MIKLFSIGFLWAICAAQAFAQTPAKFYSLQTFDKSFEIDGIQYAGASTGFYCSAKEIKKAWWKYIKAKAYILNKVSHYELKIPATSKDSLVPLYLISTVQQNEIGQSALRIAYRDGGQSGDIDALKKMLIDFKTSYFTEGIEERIRKQEMESKDLGNDLIRYQYSRSSKKLDSLEIQHKISQFEYEVHQSDLKLDSLKSLLINIR